MTPHNGQPKPAVEAGQTLLPLPGADLTAALRVALRIEYRQLQPGRTPLDKASYALAAWIDKLNSVLRSCFNQEKFHTMMIKVIATCVLTLGLGAAAHAQELIKPTPEQARVAMAHLFDDAKVLANLQLAAGTRLPVLKLPHAGQISCAVLVLSPGSSSETQADFYANAKSWVADVATRQDLPFPDLKLSQLHWVKPAAAR